MWLSRLACASANATNDALNAQLEEQQVTLEQQDLAIRQLQMELLELRNEIGKSSTTSAMPEPVSSGETSALFQNRPNPAINSTQINFYLPNKVEQASLVIFNLEGREVMRFDNLNRGYSNVMVEAGELEAGNYVYRLIADNTIVGSKTLVMAK